MQLLIIRHGQSTNNKLHADTGQAIGRVSDPRLTDLGHLQARKLAAMLGQRGIPRPTHIYSSLMIRTIETASPLAEATGLPIIARTDSFECGGPYIGSWEDEKWSPGSTRDELQAVAPCVQLPDTATESGWFAGPFENNDGVKLRCENLLRALREQHSSDDVIALVTHGCFGAFFMQHIMTSPVFCYQNNTAHSLFHLHDDGLLEAHWINRVDHLDSHEITGTA